MADLSRAKIFGKLNSVAYKTVEGATVFCKLRGNPFVELEHWVSQVVQNNDCDWHRVMRQYDIDPSRLAADITAALDRLPRGATQISDISDNITHAVERGWVYGSLMYGAPSVRTGHMLVGMLKTSFLRNALLGISRQFEKLKPDDIADRLAELTAGSTEDSLHASDGSSTSAEPGEASGAIGPAAMGKQEALKRFTTDLTDQARSGKMDPIVGRDDEIRQVVDILMRRRQNNPILVGEAGVGKTAVVEGFAQRVARGDVPPSLKDVEVRSLDVGLLQAGASMKGEFEQRLRSVIDEVQASPRPIILFVDETHTLVGAGGAAGTGDAANLLKPALARGTLRTIGATTFAEYKKHIEKDPALTRRFQSIQVDEPDEARALLMMRGITSAMEQHHRVQILDEALEAAVKLGHRYIPARQLPDKSVSLLDTACARVAVSLHATPAEVDDSSKRIEALETEMGIISREKVIGIDVATREAEVNAQLDAERTRLAALQERWSTEKKLVDELLGMRAKLRATEPPMAEEERANAVAHLRELQAQLAQLQGEHPLILPTVDYQAVATVVGDWTGIPVGRMARNEVETVLNLARLLGDRVIGQDHAMEAVARRVQTSRAGLDNPDKPVGVFMLAGPSGVGKTETALALAEALYGGEQNLITINMSEFQEAHTVSTLKGAPPGYVGYGEGGILTEAVRRRPYSVVLLDEVEKAHPDVHEIFFQVFDKGVMEDGEGRRIDFRNTLILLTSNVGTDLITGMCSDPDLMPGTEALAAALREPLLKVFPPALLGRLVAIPYFPLSPDMLARIVRLQLERIKKRVQGRYRIPFSYSEEVVDLVVARCNEGASGGRMIDAILTNTLLPDISREFLTRVAEGKTVERVAVSAAPTGFTYDFA